MYRFDESKIYMADDWFYINIKHKQTFYTYPLHLNIFLLYFDKIFSGQKILKIKNKLYDSDNVFF